MMTQTIIDTTLFSSTHPDIAKRVSISGILFSILVLLVGIFVFASVFELNDKSSVASMALLVAGTALVLFAVFRLFWYSTETVYLPTGSVARERSLFFDLRHLDTLADMVENRHFDTATGIKCCGSGNVRMDVILSQDNRFAAVQLFQFVPYSYTPITAICYFTGNDAAAVGAFLAKCKTA